MTVCLAGGTGGAKLARGLLDELGAELVVIANTGDDVLIHGAHVSPDPDLCLFWLADRIDERGWGLEGDTFTVMEALRSLGEEVWFNLGDEDLAIGLQRRARLEDGMRLTDATDALRRTLGVAARVLPMCDERVRTRVRARGAWHDFQAFMIRERAAGPVEDVAFEGITTARITPEATAAIADAEAIVIGPSNPVISIAPILAVPGVREAIAAAAAPVVAVSPIVAGAVLKGPTEAFMTWAGQPLSSTGVAGCYGDVIDGLVADEPADSVPTLVTDVLLRDPRSRRRVAAETLRFAASLR